MPPAARPASYPRRSVVAALACAAVLGPASSPALAQGGPPPHDPALSAAATTTLARADVGLRVDVRRRAGHAPLRRVRVVLPDGLLGRLLSVPFCPDPAAAAGTCAPESRLGRARVVVDTGSGPLTLAGTLSLAGPHGGTLARMVLALRSPGGRVVREAPLSLGTRDGRVNVSVPLPTSIRGAAVAPRRLTLAITRPGFLFNPSGCTGRTLDAVVTATAGAIAPVSVPYAVTGCERLAFDPDAALLNGDRTTRRRGSRPPLTVDLRPRASDAALREVRVGFPLHLQPNIELLQAVCNKDALDAGRCPAATRVATARATSPLIPGELEGPVYLTFPERPGSTGPGVELADTTIALEALGGLIRLRLNGRLRLSAGRLVSEFDGLPDVPLTSFALRLRRGSFVATRSLCSPQFDDAEVRLTGHDGATRSFDQRPAFAACQRKPLVRVTMRDVRTRRPAVHIRIRRAPRGGAIRRAVVALPQRLSVRRARRGISVRSGDRVLPRRRWSLSRRTKQLRIAARRAGRLRVVLRRGAVVAGPRTRRQARRGDLRLPFRVTVRETGGRLVSRRAYGYDEAWRAPGA